MGSICSDGSKITESREILKVPGESKDRIILSGGYGQTEAKPKLGKAKLLCHKNKWHGFWARRHKNCQKLLHYA